jgi:hypothetical protein
MTSESVVDGPDELPVVAALRTLSVFSADQGSAYREHAAEAINILGADAGTRLGGWVRAWAESGKPGVLVLTGNAGTGKTAVAETYCQAAGTTLPTSDSAQEVSSGRWVIKDLSGLPNPSARADSLALMLEQAHWQQALVCANEGVLRDALESLARPALLEVLELALRRGASRAETPSVVVVNVNRQRPTAPDLWPALLDYLFRAELWQGCRACPFEAGGCPMRSNAEQLRRPAVREQLRTLIRVGAGQAVPTLREVLAILAWAAVGGRSCPEVKDKFRDLGRHAFTATDAYFTRVLGGGLPPDVAERSPLLVGIRAARLGELSDLQIDGWLRDSSGAPPAVRALAGDPMASAASEDRDEGPTSAGGLSGSRSPLDRVRTKQGAMTFQALGEMVSTDEDPTRVEDGLDALVISGPADDAAQALWRQRIYFEAPDAAGGGRAAARRLLDYRHTAALVELSLDAAAGRDTVLAVRELVRGLNFLVTGFSSPDEGLVVPDPACLFARDPGSFRPARPSLVHSQIGLHRLAVEAPDRGMVEQLLDVDHVEVDLLVDGDPELALRIRPRIYEAICEAAEFQGPVGQGVAEMSDLRGFYGRLATRTQPDGSLRVADPESSPPAVVRIVLPHFTSVGTERR